jgi:hypothetical protein
MSAPQGAPNMIHSIERNSRSLALRALPTNSGGEQRSTGAVGAPPEQCGALPEQPIVPPRIAELLERARRRREDARVARLEFARARSAGLRVRQNRRLTAVDAEASS